MISVFNPNGGGGRGRRGPGKWERHSIRIVARVWMTHLLVRGFATTHESPIPRLARPVLFRRPTRSYRQRRPAPLAPAQPPHLLLQRLHPREQRLKLRLLRGNDRNQLFPSRRRKILHIGLFPRFRGLSS